MYLAGVPDKPAINQERLRAFVAQESRVWGANVRNRRQLLGWSLKELAEKVGTTPQTLHKVEQGEIRSRDHLRLAIAIALMDDVSRLFPMPKMDVILKAVA